MNISAINNCGVLLLANKQNFTSKTIQLTPGEFVKIKAQHTHDIIRATDTDFETYWYCRKPGESAGEINSKVRQFIKRNSFFHNDGYWKDKKVVNVEKVVNADSQNIDLEV